MTDLSLNKLDICKKSLKAEKQSALLKCKKSKKDKQIVQLNYEFSTDLDSFLY